MDHILRLISYGQTYITFGDVNRDLDSMYQGCQILLDSLAPDFEEKETDAETGKVKILKGMKTKRFIEYRKILDQARSLSNSSRQRSSFDNDLRRKMENASYQKYQKLKYSLLQECERLGYNARKTDTAEAYRDGNN